MPRAKKESGSASTSVVEAPPPSVDQKKVNALVEKIREGMPSVEAMKSQAFGVLRKHKEWEAKARPYIDELGQLLGRPVSVERYRPER